MTIRVSDLNQIDEGRLQRAVRAVIEGQGLLPGERRSPTGAEAQRLEAGQHAFANGLQAVQPIVELGYLVASADGFAVQERQALAALLEEATGVAVDRGELESLIKSVEESCATLGRVQHLRRAAASLNGVFGRERALGASTLVAIADGTLAEAELEALRELGACFDIATSTVDHIALTIARHIDRAVEAEAAS